MNLPLFKNANISEVITTTQLMQTKWAAILNPVISNELNQCSILKSVNLSIGNNIINHLLGKKLSGWFIVRQRALAEIFDTQDLNPTPNLTLTLTSNAIVTVDIAVF